MTLNAYFKVTSLFDAECLRNGPRYRHIYNGILLATYTRATRGPGRHFKCFWVTLSDLAKYSMTGSIARSLCNSWASCLSLPFCLSMQCCFSTSTSLPTDACRPAAVYLVSLPCDWSLVSNVCSLRHSVQCTHAAQTDYHLVWQNSWRGSCFRSPVFVYNCIC